MLTIDEAIKRCQEKAEEKFKEAIVLPDSYEENIDRCIECGKEHEQLAGWLMELQNLQELREPKAPIMLGIYGCTMPECPTCQYKAITDIDNFCPQCGQRLDWEAANEQTD